MKVRDKARASPCMQNDVVKCVLNFDQHSYRPGNGVKCMITLTFTEEFKYRSKWDQNPKLKINFLTCVN